MKEKNVFREPVSLSPETFVIPSNSNTSSTTSVLNKRKVTSDYSRTSKHARLPSTKSVVKQLMLSKWQANVSSVKSDVIEVEKYTLKTNQRLQYWLSNLKLTEADKELLLSPIGWLNCGMALSFNVEPDEFVQIINNRNGHWLTVHCWLSTFNRSYI